MAPSSTNKILPLPSPSITYTTPSSPTSQLISNTKSSTNENNLPPEEILHFQGSNMNPPDVDTDGEEDGDENKENIDPNVNAGTGQGGQRSRPCRERVPLHYHQRPDGHVTVTPIRGGAGQGGTGQGGVTQGPAAQGSAGSNQGGSSAPEGYKSPGLGMNS
ncbi:MAG: hypothetical protein Q9218_005522 [Villophora microphyllina]